MPEFEGNSPEELTSIEAAAARERRIEELREKFLDGTYCVDAAKISAKIIDRHLEKPTS